MKFDLLSHSFAYAALMILAGGVLLHFGRRSPELRENSTAYRYALRGAFVLAAAFVMMGLTGKTWLGFFVMGVAIVLLIGTQLRPWMQRLSQVFANPARRR